MPTSLFKKSYIQFKRRASMLYTHQSRYIFYVNAWIESWFFFFFWIGLLPQKKKKNENLVSFFLEETRKIPLLCFFLLFFSLCRHSPSSHTHTHTPSTTSAALHWVYKKARLHYRFTKQSLRSRQKGIYLGNAAWSTKKRGKENSIPIYFSLGVSKTYNNNNSNTQVRKSSSGTSNATKQVESFFWW